MDLPDGVGPQTEMLFMGVCEVRTSTFIDVALSPRTFRASYMRRVAYSCLYLPNAASKRDTSRANRRPQSINVKTIRE